MDKKNNSQSNDNKKNSNPRIMTMDSIRNSPQDPERQAYFAGGSEHSGQQILGRGKRRNEQEPGQSQESGEALAAAFRRASSSSHAGSEAKTVSFHQGARLFGGSGHRLGERDGPDVEPSSPVQITDHENNPAQVVLTLWENGYNIDDGPLQSYEDPQCADLMANIDRGELPTNLLPFEKPGPVHLSVIDKRMQKFKKSLKVFGGKGHKLGSPTPPMSGPHADPPSNPFPALSLSDQSSSGNILSNEALRNEESLNRLMRAHNSEDEGQDDVIFDDEDESSNSDDLEFVPNVRGKDKVFGGQGHVLESADSAPQNLVLQQHPSASGLNQLPIAGNTNFATGSESSSILKIRLPDGQTVQLTVDSSTTVLKLREYIRQCVPSLNNTNFSLNLTYPRRELRDDETMKSSEISNSVLVLRV